MLELDDDPNVFDKFESFYNDISHSGGYLDYAEKHKLLSLFEDYSERFIIEFVIRYIVNAAYAIGFGSDLEKDQEQNIALQSIDDTSLFFNERTSVAIMESYAILAYGLGKAHAKLKQVGN